MTGTVPLDVGLGVGRDHDAAPVQPGVLERGESTNGATCEDHPFRPAGGNAAPDQPRQNRLRFEPLVPGVPGGGEMRPAGERWIGEPDHRPDREGLQPGSPELRKLQSGTVDRAGEGDDQNPRIAPPAIWRLIRPEKVGLPSFLMNASTSMASGSPFVAISSSRVARICQVCKDLH